MIDSPYAVIDGIIGLFLVSLAVIALIHGGYRLKDNRLFAFFSVLVAVWIVTNHISNNLANPPEMATFANYFVFSCSFGAMVAIMKFIISLSKDNYAAKLMKYLEPGLWIMMLLSATPLIVKGVEKQERVYGVLFGPLISVYGILLTVMILGTYILLWRALYSRSRSAQHQMLRVVGLSLSIALPLIFLLSFVLPSVTNIFAFTEFGVTPILILVAGLYYSVVRHHLFDIRVAVVRTVAYVLSLATLSLVYFLSAYIISTTVFSAGHTTYVSMSPINIILALVLAFIFQPIKQFFDRVTDRIFFRDRYDSDEFYGRLGELLATSFDLKDLLHNAALEIGTTLKAEQAFFFVQYNHTHSVMAGTQGYQHVTCDEWKQLGEAIHGNEAIVVTDMLSTNGRHSLRKVLQKHGIAILMRLSHEHQTLGYLALGEQRTGGYTNRDIKVLETIADELVIAIQNALSVQEVRDLNVNLQARINDATKELMLSNKKLTKLDETKDEFISMASHQLRTPLTSVKGYISMVLDGDAGDISKQQRELLEQAFESSQRMVYLIGDFLNISRLRTGKFVLEPSKVDLARVVQEEVAQLQDSATARGITIRYDRPTHVPPLTADENKLRQVMMNFLDNAMYYTLAGGTVDVELYKTHTGIVFKVVDSGIGVPKAEHAKLFTKFFRAPNARKQRPDGTGIGLYMAKKVVVAHGGSILFESKEGKGSTFGFKLPLVIDPRRFDKPDEPDE